jgi:hypothetical protein
MCHGAQVAEAAREANVSAAPRIAGYEVTFPPVLPRLHATWRYLLQALQSPQPAVLSSALDVLTAVVRVAGGDFFAPRFASDCMPMLLRLLKHGPPTASTAPTGSLRESSTSSSLQPPLVLGAGGVAGKADGAAEAAVSRVRSAVLQCLLTLARELPAATSVLRLCTVEAIDAATPMLSKRAPPALRSQAVELLLALAALDEDAVWFAMVELVAHSPNGMSTLCASLPSPNPTLLPPLPALLRVRDGSVAKDCGAAAQAVLARLGGVGGVPVS